MIRKLKIRFISLSMLSLFSLLAVIVLGMNILNYNSVIREADEILAILAQNNGTFPDMKGNRFSGGRSRNLSLELPYESRFFSVLMSDAGEVIHTDTNQIASVDGDIANDYASQAAQAGKNQGFLDNFRYIRVRERDNIRVIFLDCGRKLNTFQNFLVISVMMALVGYVIVFFIISFFAGRIIRPIAESYEKQKRFITDAGHEIKTPLTIINANVDIMEMEIGENECLTDIQQQAKRLTALTNDLVCLARMEETEHQPPMIEFPVSEVVQETAMSFKALALAGEKDFTCDVQPMLSLQGNDVAIKQLVSILMDNALKYSPNGGSVSLQFVKQAKSLLLTVANTTETPVTQENLRHVFDRFYRTDHSRNSETGGHGIGLSIAKAIVSVHGGQISAYAPDEQKFIIKVVLPIRS